MGVSILLVIVYGFAVSFAEREPEPMNIKQIGEFAEYAARNLPTEGFLMRLELVQLILETSERMHEQYNCSYHDKLGRYLTVSDRIPLAMQNIIGSTLIDMETADVLGALSSQFWQHGDGPDDWMESVHVMPNVVKLAFKNANPDFTIRVENTAERAVA